MTAPRLIGPAGALADLFARTIEFEGQICREVPGFARVWVPESGAFMVSTRRVNFGHDGSAHKLKPARDKDGYWEFSGVRTPGGTSLRMHTAVLLAWHGPANGRIALHRDDCKDNNAASNLEWGTHADNGADKRIFETAVGERNGAAKMTEEFVLALREEAKTHNLGALSRAHPQFSKFALWAAVSGYTWAHLPGAILRNRKCSKEHARK